MAETTRRRDSGFHSSTGLCLKGTIPPEEASGSLNFDTNVVDIEILKEQARALRETPNAPTSAFLIEIKKREDNIWSGWISIGRAKNNDVVIAHSTISKLHARIQKETDMEGIVHYYLTDADSSAGTSANDTRLQGNTKHELAVGDQLTFGNVTCQVVDSNS